MWGNIILEQALSYNYNFGFPQSNSIILLHLSQWQYWWWFWFTFLLTLYYVLFLKTFRHRRLQFSPRLVTSLRSHGKWGDVLVCFLPISWCINILSNSNFILRLLEWQSETYLFHFRIRGRQWYWVYKLDLHNSIITHQHTSVIGTKIQHFTPRTLPSVGHLVKLYEHGRVLTPGWLERWEHGIADAYFQQHVDAQIFHTTWRQSFPTCQPLSPCLGFYPESFEQHLARISPNMLWQSWDLIRFLASSDGPEFVRCYWHGDLLRAVMRLSSQSLFLPQYEDLHKSLRSPLLALMPKYSYPRFVSTLWSLTPHTLSMPTPPLTLPSDWFTTTPTQRCYSVWARHAPLTNLPSNFDRRVSFSPRSMELVRNDWTHYIDLLGYHDYTTQTTLPLKYPSPQGYVVMKQKRYVVGSFRYDETHPGYPQYYENQTLSPINQLGTLQQTSTIQHPRRTTSLPNVLHKRLLRTRRILVLPAHIHIGVITNSFDVVHSWFVPGLGLKMDCVPGRSTHHSLYIDHAGFYYGQCAEICGRLHHHMPIRICALPFEHFMLWWYTFGLPAIQAFGKRDQKRSIWIMPSTRQYAW